MRKEHFKKNLCMRNMKKIYFFYLTPGEQKRLRPDALPKLHIDDLTVSGGHSTQETPSYQCYRANE